MKQVVSVAFVVTVLCIFSLPQIAIDLYLPALPDIQSGLGTTQFLTQLSLPIYILSNGLSQLIYGPLSERFGRKPIILMGVFIFLLGSVIVSVSLSISLFLAGRFIQGLGMGAGFTLANAILVDVFSGKQLAKMITYSSMVYSLSPLLAPVVGGFLAQYFDWQASFYVMFVLSLLLLVAIWLFVFETHPRDDGYVLSLRSLLNNYVSILKCLPFIAHVLLLTFSYGAVIVLNIVGPFLLETVLLVQPMTYGFLVLLLGGSYLLATMMNSRLLNYFSIKALIAAGILVMFVGSCGLLLSGWLGWFSVLSVMLWSVVVVFGSGLIWPNAFTNALSLFSTNVSLVVALLAALILIGISVVNVVVGHLHVEGENPLAGVFLVLTGLAFVSFRLSVPSGDDTPPEQHHGLTGQNNH